MRSITLILATLVAASLALFFHATDRATSYHVGKVQQVNNQHVTIVGTARLGEQVVTVRLNGHDQPLRNMLTGALEYDEFYSPGDRVLVVQKDGRSKLAAPFRLPIIMALLAMFAVGLLLYARKVGLNSLLSFLGSVVIIFHILIRGLLAGFNPVFITGITLLVLSAMIILSVAGWTIKGKSALLGTSVGLMASMLLCVVVGEQLHLDGMTQPLAQPLLFENAMRLNMLSIFYAAILIGASGAAMDVAMEMSATMEELKHTNPNISRKNLLKSGLRVGNAVIGTMTTTLLLAYAGGFLTLLMLFVSRESDLMQVLNMKIIAAEICRILIGSISLIIVAPATAWIASYMFDQQSHSVGQSRRNVTSG